MVASMRTHKTTDTATPAELWAHGGHDPRYTATT